ncbi:hypothetical protein BH10PAT2_BH10PAT2_1560 [soil metagenome]
MAEKITFSARPRTIIGKKSNRLRAQSLIPANISGDLDKPIAVAVEKSACVKLYDKVGDTGLVYLTVEGEKAARPVLVNEVQMDPILNNVLHVVFRQVNLNVKVEAEVPVELIGELQVKDALVVTVQDAIKVSALPQDLPEKFEIDISLFTEIGQQVTFAQLSYDKTKVELDVEEEQMETPVVLVQEVKEEVIEEPVAAVEGAEGAAAPADGAEAAGATPAGDKPADEAKKE